MSEELLPDGDRITADEARAWVEWNPSRSMLGRDGFMSAKVAFICGYRAAPRPTPPSAGDAEVAEKIVDAVRETNHESEFKMESLEAETLVTSALDQARREERERAAGIAKQHEKTARQLHNEAKARGEDRVADNHQGAADCAEEIYDTIRAGDASQEKKDE